MKHYMAHESTEIQSTSKSISHTISDNPLIAILLVTALILIVLTLVILFFSKSDKKYIKESKDTKDDESDPS